MHACLIEFCIGIGRVFSSFVPLVFSPSYLTYIKLCTLVKRNESMAHTLHGKLKEPAADENKRGARPQDLIRLYDIILQVIMRYSDTIIHIMTDTPDLLICVFAESG